MTDHDQRFPTIAIIGAGATGGYLAARLERAEVPVTLVARGETARMISVDGIEVNDSDGTWVAHPKNVLDTDALEGDQVHDVVVVCVKTYDIDTVLPVIDRLVGPGTRILSLQNGIRTDDVLAARFGADRCLSGALYVGASRTSRNSVTCVFPPRVILGPADPGGDVAAAERIRDVFGQAGIACSLDPKILAAKWQKFLFNCGLNALTTVTGLKLGALLAVPETNELFATLIWEAGAAARAAGAPLADDAEDVAIATGTNANITSSMAEDLEAGRALELDAFTGEVLDLAAVHGVLVPATKTMHALLLGMSNRS